MSAAFDTSDLEAQVERLNAELGLPGLAVGIWHGGEEQYVYRGVTSVRNPLPVDQDTLFQFGSTGKTMTASAIMRLVERGLVDLEAPVRRYVPELRLGDELVARDVTVLHLLNHTAGWEGDMVDYTGEGDDALERYVTLMSRLHQVSPLGTIVSYNNAAFSLAGRVIEKVTGATYETAMRELLLDPLGLHDTLFSMNDIMLRRFVVGHHQRADGRIDQATTWAVPRGRRPAGGMSATARDQIAWARFHLGGGLAPDGTRLLGAQTIRRMQQPTASMPGSGLGDHVGISWLLRDVDGVRLVAHGGTTIGQHSDFVIVPDRDFAVVVLTNCGPNGNRFKNRFTDWALGEYLGVAQADPPLSRRPDGELTRYAGRYQTIVAVNDVRASEGRLVMRQGARPDRADTLRRAGEDPEAGQEFVLAMVEGAGDRFVVVEGATKGASGYFTRDAGGRVDGLHFGGRLAKRVGGAAT